MEIHDDVEQSKVVVRLDMEKRGTPLKQGAADTQRIRVRKRLCEIVHAEC